MLELVLATVLTWTAPRFQSEVGCGVLQRPLTDLSHMTLLARYRYNTYADTLSLGTYFGVPGQAMQADVILPAGEFLVWAVSFDHRFNRSCASNAVLISSNNVSVPNPDTARVEGWYDVQGRRVARPSGPGVWFQGRKGTVRLK